LVANWLNFANKKRKKEKKLASTCPKKKGILDQHLKFIVMGLFRALFLFFWVKKKKKKKNYPGG
jgi:hypothetical protein